MTIMAKKRLLRWVAAVVASIVLLTGAALVAAPPSGAFYKTIMSTINLWLRTTTGQTRVYLGVDSGSILKFIGTGGTDDTDLYVDLDGATPTIYSSTDTKVQVNDGLVVDGGLTQVGDATVTGNTTFSGAVVVDGGLTQLGGDASFTGNTAHAGALAVDGGFTQTAGDASFTGNHAINGGLALDGGYTQTAGDASITGNVAINGALALDGSLTETAGDATINGNTNLDGGLTVGSTSLLSGAVTVDAGLTAREDASVLGNGLVDGSFTAAGDAAFNVNANVTNELAAKTINCSQGATVQYLNVGGDSVFGGHVLDHELVIPFHGCMTPVPANVATLDGAVTALGATTTVFYCPVNLSVGEEITSYTVYGELVDTAADTVDAIINKLDNSNGAADATGDATGAMTQQTGSTGDFSGSPANMTMVTVTTNKAYYIKVTAVAGAASAGVRLFSISVAYNSKP